MREIKDTFGYRKSIKENFVIIPHIYKNVINGEKSCHHHIVTEGNRVITTLINKRELNEFTFVIVTRYKKTKMKESTRSKYIDEMNNLCSDPPYYSELYNIHCNYGEYSAMHYIDLHNGKAAIIDSNTQFRVVEINGDLLNNAELLNQELKNNFIPKFLKTWHFGKNLNPFLYEVGRLAVASDQNPDNYNISEVRTRMMDLEALFLSEDNIDLFKDDQRYINFINSLSDTEADDVIDALNNKSLRVFKHVKHDNIKLKLIEGFILLDHFINDENSEIREAAILKLIECYKRNFNIED